MWDAPSTFNCGNVVLGSTRGDGTNGSSVPSAVSKFRPQMSTSRSTWRERCSRPFTEAAPRRVWPSSSTCSLRPTSDAAGPAAGPAQARRSMTPRPHRRKPLPKTAKKP